MLICDQVPDVQRDVGAGGDPEHGFGMSLEGDLRQWFRSAPIWVNGEATCLESGRGGGRAQYLRRCRGRRATQPRPPSAAGCLPVPM
jgi:hypothetical protein